MTHLCGLRVVGLIFIAFALGCGGGDERPKNQSPSAVFSAAPTSGPAPLVVSFDGSASDDGDGMIVEYAWAFGDGQTGAGETDSNSYANPGTYTATLTVTDDDGASDSASVQIVVGGVATDIGPAGGTAVSDDGLVSVEIPAGALSSTHSISITHAASGPSGALDGSIYHFEPDGLRFDLPVILRLGYDDASLPSGLGEESLSAATLSNGLFWHEVVGASVDAAQDELVVEVSHFSTYGLKIGAFSADLSGANEVPSNASGASGRGMFSIDTSSNVLSYRVEYQGLEGVAASAAIHGPAVPGATASVLHSLSLGSPMIDHWSYDEGIEDDLLSGRTYVSIRSAAFPNGELRGQIEPVGPVSAASELTVRILHWRDLPGASTTEQIPVDVAKVEVEVSGNDMATLTQVVPLGMPPLVTQFTLPKGMARRVDVRAFDAADQVLFRSSSVLDIQDASHALQPTLWSASDVAAPGFGGIAGAQRVAGDAIALQWPAANDDHASAAEIAYLVYMSPTPGGQDFSKPFHASQPGQTAYTVRGLAAGKDHYFVVRAMDPGGNVDGNTVEVSASTFSTGVGQYVDSTRGQDVAGCGSMAEPCKTITQALVQTPGDEPIYIARGVHDTALGESFPLQLEEGTSLHGDLAFVQTLPTSSGGVQRGTLVPTTVIRSSVATQVIVGADDAHVGGLYIEDGVNSNLATIDVDDHAMTIGWCVLKGPGPSLSTTGVQLAPGSAIRDSVVADYSSRGIQSYGDGVVIFRNTVARSGLGIAVEAGDWIISRNSLSENPLGGIYAFALDPAQGGLIFRNWVHDNGDGIELERIWGAEILSNSIQRNDGDGIRINGLPTVPPISSLISGNRLVKNGIGLFLWSEANPLVVGNDIGCNSYTDFGSWGGQEIDARDNAWDNAPPTFYDDAESNLVGCDPEGVDVCIAATYAGTPTPLLDTTAGVLSCDSTVLAQLPAE